MDKKKKIIAFIGIIIGIVFLALGFKGMYDRMQNENTATMETIADDTDMNDVESADPLGNIQ